MPKVNLKQSVNTLSNINCNLANEINNMKFEPVIITQTQQQEII